MQNEHAGAFAMIRDRLIGAVQVATIGLQAMLTRRPYLTTSQRLDAFPKDAPSKASLRIHWNDHQIPFIDARNDQDLAVGLGMVHAHLRLAQMEIMRRAAQGRIAEMVGPFGVEADRALHLLDVGLAVPAIAETLAPDTRAWIDGFVRGVNHIQQTLRTLPEEMRLLRIGREPWTVEDVLTNARLAAADVNWVVYGALLRARAALPAETWRSLWPKLIASGMPNPDGKLESALARAGSNAAAVAGWRSESGSAMLAADPHLSIALPNVWLAVGMHSPSINVAGLMPAGLPIVAIGRNPHIAWGGTSLHAAASDLIDVADEALEDRLVTLRVRGAGTRKLRLRQSRHGPVVSDGMMLRHNSPLALRWVGHGVSDEIGAVFGVMRAETADAFKRALESFATPGQNMIYATKSGDIGHVRALAAPRRVSVPSDVVLTEAAAETWKTLARTSEFPSHHNPPTGIVASANDEPPPGTVPAGFFFSPPDRVQRLRAMLGTEGKLGLDDLALTETDAQGRTEAARRIAARLPDHKVRQILLSWDGRYDTESEGAVVFEALMAALAASLPDQARVRALRAIWTGRRLLAQEVLALTDDQMRPLALKAMDRALKILRRQGSWGKLHRMPIRHYFGAVPVAGWRYRFGDYGAAGGNDTLLKTGHGPVTGRHLVTYGASARFLADMAEPDANRVILFGGQDGWLGSTTFSDQTGLWRGGAYIDIPLRVETARTWPHVTELRPV